MKSICNFGYAQARRGGKGTFRDVRGLLKYLQYRDNRDDHIPGAGGPNRWVDGGLGDCYQHILARLDELSPANRSAYCHALVISPDPQTLAQVDGDPQTRFVRAVEATLAEWEEWRQAHDPKPQAGAIEYSFVVHRPERDYGEQLHAHVILAAASEDPITRERTPLYNNRPEVQAFKEITYRQLDRAYEPDREQELRRPGPEQDLEPHSRSLEFFPDPGEEA
jgi:hypothetical protein